jgi:hypothetical protein
MMCIDPGNCRNEQWMPYMALLSQLTSTADPPRLFRRRRQAPWLATDGGEESSVPTVWLHSPWQAVPPGRVGHPYQSPTWATESRSAGRRVGEWGDKGYLSPSGSPKRQQGRFLESALEINSEIRQILDPK